MPVRSIPKNYRNVTGVATGAKADGSAAFESTLERDFLLVLEFDLNVQQFEVQPVQIDWRDSAGGARLYTPDVLVEYRRDIAPAKFLPPTLCEVKYREDLRAEWIDLRPKLRAGIRYAKQREWRFKIFTEKEIRTPYLDNARFLLPYMRMDPNEPHEELLLDRLSEMRETDPDSLAKVVFHDRWKRAELLPSLWHLVANRKIGADLGLPLTMFSRIWSKDTGR